MINKSQDRILLELLIKNKKYKELKEFKKREKKLSKKEKYLIIKELLGK